MDLFRIIILSIVGMVLISIAIIIIFGYIAGKIYEDMEEEAKREGT